MEQPKPISMKNLSEKSTMSKIKTIVYTVVITALVILSFQYIYERINAPEEQKAKTITLNEVIIAHAPETKSIIFLDRLTGKVQFSLSDTVSFAIYSIISKEIVADYTSKVTSNQRLQNNIH